MGREGTQLTHKIEVTAGVHTKTQGNKLSNLDPDGE